MRKWKIERISTFDDGELENKLNEIESKPNRTVQNVVYMGDNPAHIRIYQIIYTEEK